MPAKLKNKRRSPARSPSGTRSAEEEAAPAVVDETAPPASDAVPRDIIAFKESFTTPSMVYDATTRRIVPHPQYDVAVVQQLARVQGTLLSVLRQAEANSASLTPKQLLFELERALMYVFSATCVAENDTPLSYVLTDADAVQYLPTLEGFLARREANGKAITAAAYVLSQGASATALSGFLDLLLQRLAAELSPDVQQRRPDGPRAALHATHNNLSDGAEQIRALQIHFQSISTEAQVARQMPSGSPDRLSPEANSTAAQSVANEYYNTLRWLLAVEQDRQALQPVMHTLARTAAAPVTTLSADDVDAVVREYDPFEGKIVLERPTPTSRWGLMLNQNGYLVGVENKLRNASEDGGRLYQSLRQQGDTPHAAGDAPATVDGLAVLQVNRAVIRPANLTPEDVAARQADILNKLREALSKDSLTLHLRVQKRPQSELGAPREVLFDVCQQGGEHSVGQRVVLVLQRPSTQVRWGLDVEFGESAADVLLRDFQNSLQLSTAAKNFLFDHRGQLGVVQVNYKNVADLPDGKAGFATLMSTSLLIALQLQVLAPTPTTGRRAAAVASTPAPVLEDADAPEAEEQADDVAEEIEESAAVEEADEAAEDEAAEELAEEAAERPEAVEETAEKPLSLDDAESLSRQALDHVGVDDDNEFAKVSEAIVDQYLQDEGNPAEIGAPEEEAEDAEAEDTAEGEEVEHARVDGEEDRLEGQEWANIGVSRMATTTKTRKVTSTAARVTVEVTDDDGHRELLEEYDIATDAPLRDEEEPVPRVTADGDDGLETVMDMMADQLQQSTPAVAASAKKGKRQALAAEEADVAEVEEKPKGTRQRKGKADAAKKTKKAAKKSKKAAKGKKGKKGSRGQPKATDEEDDANAEDAVEEDVAEATEEQAEVDDDEETKAVEEADAAADPLDAVRDTPLITDAKDRAELAIEEAQKSARRRKKPASEDAAEPKAPKIPSRVGLSELVDAPPLPLNHSVRIDRFDGTALELHRGDVQDNWDISVAYNGTDLILSGINALSQARLQAHPFAKALHASPEGRVNWTIESINGKDMFGLDKQAKMNVLKTLKNPITTLRLVLKR